MLWPPAPQQPPLPPGTFKLRGVTVSIGGFIEAASIFRTRNETADIASNWNTGIPLNNTAAGHENELRFSARQSRLSLEAQANPDPVTHIDSYFELDFLGAAPTANSVESNSYNPRIRHLYASYDRSDLGLHLLAGQTWSLLTMSKSGIDGKQSDENIPLTIDAQYVPGFDWARQPQFRIVKDFGKTFWLAASVESPQTNYYTGPNGLVPASTGTVNISNGGGSNFYSGNNYSDEVAPDVVAKAALDVPLGHFEAYGVARFLHDRLSEPGSGTSNTVLAGGGGAAALVHVVPKMLDLQASFLAGEGIGRYGTAQLPDATIGADGSPKPLPEVEALAGVIAHPLPNIDLYGYGGFESVSRRDFTAGGKGYGYGSPLYSNASCDTELGASSSCVGNTSSVAQGTVGGWWKVLHSKDFGSVQVGAQYSYTRRSVFDGVGPTPKASENVVLFSIRLYPFQDTAPSGPPIL
jgi:hypothetical protein